MPATRPGSVAIQTIGGPTAILEVGGLRIIVDPTFDPPGRYARPDAPELVKTAGPAIPVDAAGALDVALVSHDHHPDNLDHEGRRLLDAIPRVFTTTAGAERVGGCAQGLAPYESADLGLPAGGTLRITAVPAQHGPDGTDHITGPVLGFYLTGEGLPTIYVSGDNASVDVVAQIVGAFAEAGLADRLQVVAPGSTAAL